MEMTEQKIAEALGVSEEWKAAGETAEAVDNGGAQTGTDTDTATGSGTNTVEDPEGAADGTGAGAEGDAAGNDGGTGEDGDNGGTQELTLEERRANAERHRQERERRFMEAAEKAAQLREDETYRTIFAGQNNPFTGKPINSKADYDAWQAMQKNAEREQTLKDAGVAPDTIRSMVDEQLSPLKEQLQRQTLAAQTEEARRQAQARNAEFEAGLQKSLAAVSAIDSSVKTMEDIVKMPTGAHVLDLVKRGYTLEDAFETANRKSINEKRAAAAFQKGVESVRGRAHMDPQKAADGAVEVPAAVMKMYRQLDPSMTEAEIRADYAAQLKEQNNTR